MKLFQQWVLGLVLGGYAVFANASTGMEADNSVALGLLNQGVVHCTRAIQTSRTDPVVAQKEYETYVTALTRAQAIYPDISQHSRTLSRQLQQCTQIGDDIARTRALPLLEEGFLACKQAKSLAKGDYLTKARVKYKEYLELRDKAISLTESVLKVASNSSKVRRCDKLESGLMAAQSRVEQEESEATALISVLQRAEDSCQVAQRMAVKSGESRAKLEATKSMLSHAERYFNETQLHQDAAKRAKNYPGYGSSKKIQAITSQFSVCRDELVAIISAATQSIVRNEELAKIRQQQKLDEAVALAVAKAKQETAAAFAQQQAKTVRMQEAKAVKAANGKTSDSGVADKDNGVTDEVANVLSDVEAPEKSVAAKVRFGKASRGARTEVVQVTESW